MNLFPPSQPGSEKIGIGVLSKLEDRLHLLKLVFS